MARTILLFQIISARPSKQPRMVRTFLNRVPINNTSSLWDVSDSLCLSPAKIRSTDSKNPWAVLSRVRPRYRHLL